MVELLLLRILNLLGKCARFLIANNILVPGIQDTFIIAFNLRLCAIFT